jgi:hypothetical protein
MERGSEKILQAWRARLDEASVEGIAKHFGASSAEVVSADVDGGGGALRVVSRYAADDFEQCGNDLAFWLNFLRQHGSEGTTVVPRVIVNGRPAVDSAVLALHFGASVASEAVEVVVE